MKTSAPSAAPSENVAHYKRLGAVAGFIDKRKRKAGIHVFWRYALFVYPYGISWSIPVGDRWRRGTLGVKAYFDDGCINFQPELILWHSRTIQGALTHSKDSGSSSRAYVTNTKRYVRFLFKVRYRGRKIRPIGRRNRAAGTGRYSADGPNTTWIEESRNG